MSEKKEETVEKLEEDVIETYEPITVSEMPREVVKDIGSTPFWAKGLLGLYMIITPFLAWFFGWSWWPGFGIYIILVVIFGVILTCWGYLRRRPASVKTTKAEPDTRD